MDNPTNAHHIGLETLAQPSVVPPATLTSDEKGINENANCATPAPVIDSNLGHSSQLVARRSSKLFCGAAIRADRQ